VTSGRRNPQHSVGGGEKQNQVSFHQENPQKEKVEGNGGVYTQKKPSKKSFLETGGKERAVSLNWKLGTLTKKRVREKGGEKNK